MKKIDLTGKKFGRYTAIKVVGKTKNGIIKWLCRCDCGNERIVQSSNLKSGNSKSCGCWNLEQVKSAKSHGMAETIEYCSWTDMKTRCYNSNSTAFHNYGGRNITVCERWLHSFENFIADMGMKPTKKHTLERIDVNGNYEPSNCKWITKIEQARNRRSSHWIEHNGKRMILSDWAKLLNIKGHNWQRNLKLKPFEYWYNKYTTP